MLVLQLVRRLGRLGGHGDGGAGASEPANVLTGVKNRASQPHLIDAIRYRTGLGPRLCRIVVTRLGGDRCQPNATGGTDADRRRRWRHWTLLR